LQRGEVVSNSHLETAVRFVPYGDGVHEQINEYRADGLIKATYAMLGEVVYTVPDEAVKSRVMTVHVEPKGTGVNLNPCFLNTDGTVNYARMISYLTEHEQRNRFILDDLTGNRDHYNLILSERVDHLKYLYSQLPPALKRQAAVIDGKMTTKTLKAEREQAILCPLPEFFYQFHGVKGYTLIPCAAIFAGFKFCDHLFINCHFLFLLPCGLFCATCPAA